MPAGKPQKEFHQYICPATSAHVSHRQYLNSPATTFLKYTIEAKDAIDMCIRKFPKIKSGSYSSDSLDSLQHLSAGMLPAIMGHFETFQKSLFAGMFELSVFSSVFKVESFVKKLNDGDTNIDLTRLLAYRNIGASSVGQIVADSLSGWHSPEKVNIHFQAFGYSYNFYSTAAVNRLKTLWQMRHSIVHTGGTLTLPDAQKVKDLKSFGDTNLAFENNFIFEVCRKFHPIIKQSTVGMEAAFKRHLVSGLPAATHDRINNFFEVKSSIAAWLA